MGLLADTRITTTIGSRRVGDLVGKQFSVAVEGRVFASGKRGFYDAGTEPTWEVCLENGARVVASGTARIMTFDGWKNVGELRPKHDSVLLASMVGLAWGGKGTEDDGYVAGFLWANKSPRGFSVLVSNDTDADNFGPIRKIKDIYYNKRGRRKHFVMTGRDMCYRRHTMTSSLFPEIAKEHNLFDGDGNARLCEDGSHAFIMGVLKGIFDAAGIIMHNIGKHRTTLRLRDPDTRELRTAQRLLMTATGITPSIEGDELIISGDEDIGTFQQKIGFRNNEKNRLLSCFRPKNVMRKDYRYTKVVSVRRQGEERVYKTECPNCFYADGVLAHA